MLEGIASDAANILHSMDSTAFHAGSVSLQQATEQDHGPHIAHIASETGANRVAGVGNNTPRSSSGQDGGLSRRKPEFDSPSGHGKSRLACASVAQSVEATGSNPVKCAFESHRWHSDTSGGVA